MGILINGVDPAVELTRLTVADLYTVQGVYPTQAAPVTLPAQGGAWTYGVLTEVIPASTIITDFHINKISISAMDANGNYQVKVTYGAGDTEFCTIAISRGGVQTDSAYVTVQGPTIPANSVIKAQVSDSVGTSTLAIKVLYHPIGV